MLDGTIAGELKMRLATDLEDGAFDSVFLLFLSSLDGATLVRVTVGPETLD